MTTAETLDAIIDLAMKARAQLLPPVSTTTHLVKAGESLQAALDLGVLLTTEDGVTFPGTYVYPSGTNIVFGAGSGITATTQPACIIKPGTRGVKANGIYASTHPQKITIGAQDEALASDITFQSYTVPPQIGKRAFDIHGDNVRLLDGEVAFITGPNQDSQAIYVGAGTGGTIARNTIRAGAEVLLFGGTAARSATFRTPTNWTVEDNDITRDKAVQTDAVNDLVKNLVECKNLIGGTFRRNRIHNNWRDTKGGQSGYAILLTPADDGMPAAAGQTRYSGIVKDILFEDNDIFDVSSAFQLMGLNYASVTPEPLTNVMIRNNRVRISRALFADGGLGQFVIASSELGTLDIEDNTILSDGSSFFYTYAGAVLQADGFKRTNISSPAVGKFAHIGFQRNRVGFLGSYGFNLWGLANAKEPAWQASCANYTLAGNIYNGQARSGYLGGVFLAGPAFDVLPEVVRTKAIQ
jgi:hypothetical protein